MAYLYRHIRLDKNVPFYIGIGSDDEFKRANSNKSRNRHWRFIVSKTSHRVDVMFDGLSWNDACIKEIEFIALYGRRDLGKGTLCNLTDGGDGSLGIIHSQEYRNKLSKILKEKAHWKGKNLSKETKEKISENLKGRYRGKESPHYGKSRPQELVDRIAEMNRGNTNMLGKKHSQETKIKMSESHKGNKNWLGKEHSQETKDKIGKANKGKQSPNKGKVASLELRAKLSKAHKGKVLSQEHRDNISKANKGRKQKKRV